MLGSTDVSNQSEQEVVVPSQEAQKLCYHLTLIMTIGQSEASKAYNFMEYFSVLSEILNMEYVNC